MTGPIESTTRPPAQNSHPTTPKTWAQVDQIVEMEFELDNLAQHGGADLATTIELASLAYGTTKGGITLTRIGTKYFLRSGDDIITELGPTTIRQLDKGKRPGRRPVLRRQRDCGTPRHYMPTSFSGPEAK